MSASGEPPPRALPLDYDQCPDRFRTGRAVIRAYGVVGDVHDEVATRFRREGLSPILDVGCGDGMLGRLLTGGGLTWIGLDLSRMLLADAPRAVVRGDAAALPFRAGTVGGVAALYMLYHLPAPERAVAEACRVLRPGGLFVAAAPSRHDSPELSALLPAAPPLTFDAEIAPSLVRRFFSEVEVQAWDGPFLRLPDAEALRRYLVGRTVSPALAAECARQMAFPVTVTKRGALVYGRKDAGGR
jgi:SAM-dependent methyltransferase